MLGTQMKSVGEVMAIGRTFKQALAKGVRSLETGRSASAAQPLDERADSAASDHAQSGAADRTSVSRWSGDTRTRRFTRLPGSIRGSCGNCARRSTSNTRWRANRWKRYRARRCGAPNARESRTRSLARGGAGRRWRCARGGRSWASRRCSIAWIRARRSSRASRRICIRATNRRTRRIRGTRPKVMILGSGPNRIGQGIEFDYCCCHASFALHEFGYESIMVNCNPETVSTDYDTSDRLYFEPLTLEEVLNMLDTENPQGVIVQFGGQTPLNLALPLKRDGVPIIGTDPANIDLAEDRKLFGRLLDELGIPAPPNGTATIRKRLRGGAADRVSGAGAAQLRAGRARHGDRVRRGNGAALYARGRDLFARPAGADRPVSGRGDRGRRGCAGRRRRAC